MKKVFFAICLMLAFTPIALAQAPIHPFSGPGGLGRLDPGAISTFYTNPSVPNTYEYIDPHANLGVSKENPADVINVEKADVFGKIIINSDNTINQTNP